jgi:hypothetical protein
LGYVRDCLVTFSHRGIIGHDDAAGVSFAHESWNFWVVLLLAIIEHAAQASKIVRRERPEL